MKKELIKAVSSVKSSKYRFEILKTISNNILTPVDITTRTNYQQSHVSKFLRELKGLKLVVCLNDDEKRGRLYQITTLGKRALKVIQQNEGV